MSDPDLPRADVDLLEAIHTYRSIRAAKRGLVWMARR